MKNIIMISAFVGDLRTAKSSRIYKIKRMFESHGGNVRVVTSDFLHGGKKYKDYDMDENEIRLHVPSYKKNISFGRIISHIVFAIKTFVYLKKFSEKIDAIYCSAPTSLATFLVGKYAKKHNIFYIVDIIDLWPDSLIPIYSNKFFEILMAPWRWVSRSGYKLASYISAESQKYAEMGHVWNQTAPYSYTYLGINSKLVSSLREKIVKTEDCIRICYGGSLGLSYDFENILLALKKLRDHGINYSFVFVGDGDRRDYIETFSKENNLNVKITGRLNYNDFLLELLKSDIALNSFKENTKVVHSYKFNDYVATHCFVINSLVGETADMIDKYKIGRNYQVCQLPDVLVDVCEKWDFYKEWKKNNDLLIRDVLDEDVIYDRLFDRISLAYQQK